MATRCEVCGKKPAAGYNVSHSQRHTKRRWKPNVQKTTLVVDGQRVQLAMCTRCQRTYSKAAAA